MQNKKSFFFILPMMMAVLCSCGSGKNGNATHTTLTKNLDIVEVVDLGLSVKWASANVGATCGATPESWYGDYFAWGETKPKNEYEWSTYKWCNGSEYSMTKYCKESKYGQVDNKTVLDAADDAARVNWGGSWRMPTEEEISELRNNCTWTWTTDYDGISGLNGYVVKSRKIGYTDKFIFLPAAGFCCGSLVSSAGSIGDYWSSSLYENNSYYAYYLYFFSGYMYWFSIRCSGHSVRPVCQ